MPTNRSVLFQVLGVSALTVVAIATPSAQSEAAESWSGTPDAVKTDVMWGAAGQLMAEAAPTTSMTELLIAQSDDEEYEDDANDPLEPVNRVIFGFNEAIYDLLLRPLAYAYNDYVNEHIRYLLGNLYETISSPVTLANDLLQGEFVRARDTTARIVTNTVWGFAGIVDLAEEFGFEEHNEDFGQTLAVWGVPEGFYVVLPIFGPSSPRRAVGQFFVDRYFSPFAHWTDNDDHPRDTIARSHQLGSGLHQFASVVDELDDVKKTSIDYYAAVRSLYRQKRNSEIANGETIDLPPIPDLGYELELDDLDGETESGEADGVDGIENPFGIVYDDTSDGVTPVAVSNGIDSLTAEAFGQPGDVPLPAASVEVAETGSVRATGTVGSF